MLSNRCKHRPCAARASGRALRVSGIGRHGPDFFLTVGTQKNTASIEWQLSVAKVKG